jgi:predicted amidohydrolase YtcJ
VAGCTNASADPFRAEDALGTIEVGKIADLVVLNQNFFELDRNDIHRTGCRRARGRAGTG